MSEQEWASMSAQESAYEIAIGDWSSDVCSSDLARADIDSYALTNRHAHTCADVDSYALADRHAHACADVHVRACLHAPYHARLYAAGGSRARIHRHAR